MANPKFLFAFSYDPANALPEVIRELNALQSIFSGAGAEPIIIWQATQEMIESYFVRYREEIRLFHFSGHAGENTLQLNGVDTGAKITFAEGLAGFSGIAKCLRLVFLNGCSTREQAQYFLEQGASAVIATTVPLLDHYGVDFARRFYQNFTSTSASNAGLSLQDAFQAAWQSFTGAHGLPSPDMLHERVRSIFQFSPATTKEPLYQLWTNAGKPMGPNERFVDWQKACIDREEEVHQKKENIRKYIAQGKLEQALTELVAIIPDGIQLQGQYQAASNQFYMSLMNNRDWLQIQAQISYSILQLLRNQP